MSASMSGTFDGDGELQTPVDPVQQLPTNFTAFFDGMQGVYLRYAYQRLRNLQDAEDAVQNGGMRIYAKWTEALSHANLPAFTFTIMRGAVTDYLRARSRAERASRAAIDAARQKMSIGQLERLADYDALDRAMEHLARTERVLAECVRLRNAGMPYPEIAKTLEITQGTARTYYSRGLRRVQALLGAYQTHDTEGDPS